jgi:wyosine [tRNA(Phe)-imidazoG37] synthetase (radical SAM superfamily)
MYNQLIITSAVRSDEMTIAFGPVPSRRLGRSLGINNIPPKSCSYSCIYCQVGTTIGQKIEPRVFYTPEDIYQAVSQHLKKTVSANEDVDYLTFVPDGEPTLDINLSKTIDLLRPLKIPIAVISNASLLWHKEVRAAIDKADWVSLKVDSVNEKVWKQVNQPHEALSLDKVMDGIHKFASDYQGKLVAETMLIDGVNDDEDGVSAIADFLKELDVSCGYVAIPTRPTTEKSIRAPNEIKLNRCYQVMAASLDNVEFLIGYEGDAFAFTGDVQRDLLSITAVHPMRESAVNQLLMRANADWSLIDDLIAKNELKAVDYLGERYFVRSTSSVCEMK